MSLAVGFCADKRMEAPLHVAASSVLTHAAGPVDFYFLLSGFQPADCQRLRDTLNLRARPHTVTIIPGDAHMDALKHLLPLHGAVSPYLRLLLPDLVSRPRLLYLDSDIVCHTDVSLLADIPMQSTVGFVECGTAANYPECGFYPSIGLSLDTPAFNSGVMLVACEAWKQEQWAANLLTFCRENNCHDQPGLIGVCNGSFTRLPQRMNIHLYPTSFPPVHEGIYHFVGSPKPWDIGGRVLHKSYHIYAEELKHTVAPRWSGLRLSSWQRAYRVKGGYYRTLRARREEPE